MGGQRRTVAFSDGRQLRFTVLVGTNGDDNERLIDSGILPKPPIKAKAVLDTGAATTSVSPEVLRLLLAAQVGEADNETAGGMVRVGLYIVSIGFFADDAETISDSVVLNLEVSEFAHPINNTDVLIGMDVLQHCRLLVDGPAKTFTIEF